MHCGYSMQGAMLIKRAKELSDASSWYPINGEKINNNRVATVFVNPGKSWNWGKKFQALEIPWIWVVVLENPGIDKKLIFLSLFPKIIKIIIMLNIVLLVVKI